MSERRLKEQNAQQRAARTRVKVKGSAVRPRLSVNISNKHVSAQLIDDAKGVSLTAVSTTGATSQGSLTQKASQAGKDIASAAKKLKIKKIVFDRGDKQYHGRIKALADAARENGLEF